MLEALKAEVLKANLDLVKYGLVTLTWGNASGIDHTSGLVVIKPSGVNYETMTPDDMAVVDLQGNIVEGDKRPSSDTATHIELYKAFPDIKGIAHTHSTHATIFAQGCVAIPCLGTTHADHFAGAVPVTRFLSKEEVESDYEKNTGKVIIETMQNLDPNTMPGILVAGHAPFTWGISSSDAVRNALILERVAEMALGTLQLTGKMASLPEWISEKHFQRKHGPHAYYGQKKQ